MYIVLHGSLVVLPLLTVLASYGIIIVNLITTAPRNAKVRNNSAGWKLHKEHPENISLQLETLKTNGSLLLATLAFAAFIIPVSLAELNLLNGVISKETLPLVLLCFKSWWFFSPFLRRIYPKKIYQGTGGGSPSTSSSTLSPSTSIGLWSGFS